MKQLSRREFSALVATGAVAARIATPYARIGDSAVVTAGDVIDRIKKNIGVEWRTQTVDTLKVGDPSTVVTGIVTTSMATLDVLQQAVKAGANLVITAQPTFILAATRGRRRPDVAEPAGPGSWSACGSSCAGASASLGSGFRGQERLHHGA